MNKIKKKLSKMVKKGILSKKFDPWVEKERKHFYLFKEKAGEEISIDGVIFRIILIPGGGSGHAEFPPEIHVNAIRIEEGFGIFQKKEYSPEHFHE